jgi:hypothetical protein
MSLPPHLPLACREGDGIMQGRSCVVGSTNASEKSLRRSMLSYTLVTFEKLKGVKKLKGVRSL